MECFKCKKNIDLKKIPFRATCDECGSDLHVCKNCKYYFPGKPNDCSHPSTESVIDRERFNFCEEFRPIDKQVEEKKKTITDSENLLFSDKTDQQPKDFNSLFDN